MPTLLDQIKAIQKEKLPEHIAVIMDGNGRWAKQRGKERIYGHQQGVHAVRSIIEGAGEAGVSYLTLYAFSKENWKRPQDEVNALTSLLVKTIHAELDRLIKNEVRLLVIGDSETLPADCREQLALAIARTAHNKQLTVTLALSYSSQWEIVEMVKKIGEKVKNGEIRTEEIDSSTVRSYLATAGTPDPDILIRTGGEYRISNFLLWQIAYTELFFSPIMWPDFRKEDLWHIILDYTSRERRFGKTGEQVLSH